VTSADRTWRATGTSLVAEGLANGTTYTFSIRALNDIGEGTATQAGPVTPVATPVPRDSPGHDPRDTPGRTSSSSPGQAFRQLTASAVSGGNRLKVNVDPNLRTGNYRFKVKVLDRSGTWKSLRTTYATTGTSETRSPEPEEGHLPRRRAAPRDVRRCNIWPGPAQAVTEEGPHW
jgi:hypothetical protein